MEITKGSKVKYELDKKTGLIKVQTNCMVIGVEFETDFTQSLLPDYFISVL